MSEIRLADRAHTSIVQLINTDGLEVGHRLPSETHLAEIIGVSRTIVREALVRLASDGITEARRGRLRLLRQTPPLGPARGPHANGQPFGHAGQL